MKYCVNRTRTITEYVTVEADSENEAIEKAKEYPEECWKEDNNDIIMNYFEYYAEKE